MLRRFVDATRSGFGKLRQVTKDPRVKEAIVDSIAVFVFFHVFAEHVIGGSLCVGPSMLPTLREEGDVVLIDRISAWFWSRRYQKNDVVISICPYDPNKAICKRVMGTAGDVVQVDWGYGQYRQVLVPPGHLWLSGDNAENSLDSRRYGAVPEGLVMGRVLCKLRWAPPFVYPIEDRQIKLVAEEADTHNTGSGSDDEQ